MEHYKADNDRLIKLLRDNGRTRDLGEFLQDNKGGVRYLAGKKTHGKKELQNEENENWIPHEAYEIAHKYRTERPEGMSKVEIDKMMRELNVIWRDRERRMVARIKNKCNAEIRDLRRQIAQRAPVSETNQAQTIQRLKDQLKEAKRDLRNNVAKKKLDSNRPEEVDHVE